MIPYSYLAMVSVSSAGAVTDEWCFTDGVRYALVEYAPGVAARRASRVGGNGAWDEVADSLTVHVLGGTATQCAANYDDLIRALDQAARWRQEDGAEVVQLRMQTLGGTVGELATVVLGAEPGEQPASVRPAFDETDGCWIIRDVTLKFARRGLLLVSAVETATGTTVTTGEISTATLASHGVLSPCRSLAELDDGADSGYGYWLSGSSASQFQVFNGSSMTPTADATAAAYSYYADAAVNRSRSGTVLRITPASGAAVLKSSVAITTLPSTYPVAHVFAAVRPASATPIWDLQALHYDSLSFSGVYQAGPRVPVPQVAGVSIVYLGTVARVEQWSALVLVARVTTAAYPQTLDIDSIVMMGDDETANIVGVLEGQRIAFAAPALYMIALDPRPLSHVGPAVSQRISGGIGIDLLRYPLSYRGDAYAQQRGASMAGVLYLNSANNVNAWRPGTSTASIAGTMRLTAKRYKGYRVPQ